MIIIGQISDKKSLESQFEISFTENQDYVNKYFIDKEDEVFVITCQQKRNFSLLNYGMVPFWSGKKTILLEAPAEGEIDEQTEQVNLKKRIIIHPSYRKPIRENRCIVPADYVIMPTEYGEVFLLYFSESKPFAIAGIYDSWKETYRDDIEYRGFSLITVPSNELLKKAGISRMPLFLNSKVYNKWLDREAPLTDITALIETIPDKNINGYPILRNTFLNKVNTSEIYRSSGDLLRKDENHDFTKITSVLKAFRSKGANSQGNNISADRMWRE